MARLFYVSCSLPLLIRTVSAANSTVVHGWVQDPNTGRGTFSIVSSCLLTLSLCVYTAVHLNVPRQNQTEFQGWLRTARWVAFGILAPEMVVYVAWRQFKSACALEREIKQVDYKTDDAGLTAKDKEAPRPKPGNNDPIRKKWTKMHSFYAAMGGFAVDIDDESVPSIGFRLKQTRLTLTARAVRLLDLCGSLPDVSREDIKDKSKADNLTKLVSLLQVIWMLVQICGRLAKSLPVTLLEVNTLAHVICALVIYVLWWHKPKLVQSPTILRGDWTREFCAYMYMSSQMSGWPNLRPGVLKKTWRAPAFSLVAVETRVPPSTEHGSPMIDFRDRGNDDDAAVEPESGIAINTKSPTVFSNPALKSPCFRLTRLTPDDRIEADGRWFIGYLKSTASYQNLQWHLAAQAHEKYPILCSRLACLDSRVRDGAEVYRYLPLVEELVVEEAQNWPNDELLRGMSGFVMGMVLWAFSVGYGGLHAAAWTGYFPTATEAVLWRVSAIVIAGSGIVWVLINAAAHVSRTISVYWNSVEALDSGRVSLWGLGGLASLCGLLYLAARVYLVVEAFISLRSLPAGAYETPDWTQVFPHL